MGRGKFRRGPFGAFLLFHALPGFERYAGIIARFGHQDETDPIRFSFLGTTEEQRHSHTGRDAVNLQHLIGEALWCNG